MTAIKAKIFQTLDQSVGGAAAIATTAFVGDGVGVGVAGGFVGGGGDGGDASAL